MGQDDDRKRDDRSGRYTTEFESDAFVEAVQELGLASTRDVADAVGCSYDLAYRRLKDLADDGSVEGTKVGNTYHWRPVD